MTFRTRQSLASSLVVGVSIAAASAIIYVAERADMNLELRDSLLSRASEVTQQLREGDPEIEPPPFGGPGGYAQVIMPSGHVTHFGSRPFLPVTPDARLVAAGIADSFFEDVLVEEAHVRVLTMPLEGGRALQVARPLDEIDEYLTDLRLLLTLVTLCAFLVGAGLSYLIAGGALKPLKKLTTEVEEVADNGHLAARIEIRGKDELTRLTLSVNRLLEALQSAVGAQHQLVADASHELRTPLTSIRTNIDVLTQEAQLPPLERSTLLEDTQSELERLSRLVDDLIELARAEGGEVLELDELDAAEVARQAVALAQKRAPRLRFLTRLAPFMVVADRAQIQRAVSNLVDNAVKLNGEGPVEITVKEGSISVRDHGPGIAFDDLPRLFDRFYRGSSSGSSPGSGLGLAIVQAVAERHGWRLTGDNAEGGGAVFRIDFVP